MDAPADVEEVLKCPKCALVLIPREIRRDLSLGAWFGALVLLIGLCVAIVSNEVDGLLLFGVGIIISVACAGKRLVMVCPKCGTSRDVPDG